MMSHQRFEYEVQREEYNDHDGELPIFLVADSLKRFIDNDLRTMVSSPIKYREEYEQGEVDTARELANDPEYQEWLTRTLKEDLEYRMGKGE